MIEKMSFRRQTFDGDTDHISDAIVSESLTSGRDMAEVAGEVVAKHNFSHGQLANIVAQSNRAMTNAVRDLKPQGARGNYTFEVLTVDALLHGSGKSKSATKVLSEPVGSTKQAESPRLLRRNLYTDPSYRVRLAGSSYDPFAKPKEKVAKLTKPSRVRVGEVMTLEEIGKCKVANLAGLINTPTADLARSFDSAVATLKLLVMGEDRSFSQDDVCHVLRQLGVSEEVILDIMNKPMKVRFPNDYRESAPPSQIVLNIKHPMTKAMLRVATLFSAMTRSDTMQLDDEDDLVGSVAFSDPSKAEAAFSVLLPDKKQKKASRKSHKPDTSIKRRADTNVSGFLGELGI